MITYTPMNRTTQSCNITATSEDNNYTPLRDGGSNTRE